MSRANHRRKGEKFATATASENNPLTAFLRRLLRRYAQHARRRKFAAEARRQSRLVASSADEAEVMNWIRDVSGRH